jgi:tRNA pseudouridine32 synthase/23S rRNA pseudouridine746 synthase
MKDKFLRQLDAFAEDYPIPDVITLQGNQQPLALLAAEDLQYYLETQTDLDHNFGLVPGQKGAIIGKMFGVLVVKSRKNMIGYLAAFSGKLAGTNDHTRFVPPVFDSLGEYSFVTEGMRKLSQLSAEIKNQELHGTTDKEHIKTLKLARRNHSYSLQQKIFNCYYFLNEAGEKKSLNQIFKNASYKNPPSGAGECAGPKLLQYAFKHQMKPLAMTEFWWGLSPKSEQWKHRKFYECCREKCQPILNHMLSLTTFT